MKNPPSGCQMTEVTLEVSRTVQLKEYHPVTMRLTSHLVLDADVDPSQTVEEGYAYLTEQLDNNLGVYLKKLQYEPPTRGGLGSSPRKAGSPLRPMG